MKASWIRKLLNTFWLWWWNTTFYADTGARRFRKKVLYLQPGFGHSYTAIILLVVVLLWLLRRFAQILTNYF